MTEPNQADYLQVVEGPIGAAVPTEESPVNRAIDNIRSRLTALEDTTAALHSKAGPVMIPDPVEQGDGVEGKTSPPVHSSLTNTLSGLSERIGDVNTAIREIIDRLEV